MGEAQWYISWDEFKELPPSLKFSTLEQEIENRKTGTEFINKLGHSLGLSQLIISTAQVFFHRFYLRETFKQYPLNEMALTMTFLASKVEESPRKLRDVILKGCLIRFRSAEVVPENSTEYQNLYERVIQLEKTALAVLCFDLTVDHPFRHLARLFNSHPDKFDANFTKHIWTILTESFCSPLPILFPPRVLAISILKSEMSKRPDLFPERPINLAEFIGEKGDAWEKHFPKVPQEEVEKALMFLDTKYYDILEIQPDATASQIKKAYYVLAMKYHPDKNLDQKEEAEKKFKEIGEAYQVLSDPEMRKRYDEFGYEAAKAGPEGGFADPREIFRQIFGGEAFVEIIGEISFVKMFMEAAEEGQEDGTALDSQAHSQYANSEKEKRRRREQEDRKIRKERVATLKEKLLKKISLYTEGNFTAIEFQNYIKEEAMRLRTESLGTELLHAVGYTYEIRARQHLGRDELLGLTGVYHSFREKGHSISNFFSTVKAAGKAINSARNIQEMSDKAAANGSGPVEPPPHLVKEAGDNMRDLLVKAVTVEVQSVIGDVCNELLETNHAPNLASKAKKLELKKRAEALKIIGKVYCSTPAPPPGESNNFF